MGLLSSLLGTWGAAAADTAAPASFCEAQFPQVGSAQDHTQLTTHSNVPAARPLTNAVLGVVAGLQMFANFVDHVVDTAYTGSCIADPDPEVRYSDTLTAVSVATGPAGACRTSEGN
jgi:hypothetical protein